MNQNLPIVNNALNSIAHTSTKAKDWRYFTILTSSLCCTSAVGCLEVTLLTTGGFASEISSGSVNLASALEIFPQEVSKIPTSQLSHQVAQQVVDELSVVSSPSNKFNQLYPTFHTTTRLPEPVTSELIAGELQPEASFYVPSVSSASQAIAQQPSTPISPAPATNPANKQTPATYPSTALNIIALRSLRKPVGNKVLDTGVSVAGIRPKDTSEHFWTRDFLTGNWGGFRDYLYKKGIDLYLVHFIDAYGNLAGGLQQKPLNYSGITLVGLDFYTSKLGWWQNGQIHLTATEVEGVSVGRKQSGALNSLYFVDPTEYGPRLFELWYGQQFGKRRQYEFRLGKIFPFVRIAAAQTASIFTNTSFQYPSLLGVTDLAGNRVGKSAAFAAAPFGLQFSYTHSPEWLFIGQIQDGFNDLKGGTENRTNFRTGLSANEGIEGIAEAVYRLNQRPNLTGLPGTYRFGMQFHTGQFDNNRLNQDGKSLALFGGARRKDYGNYGFYLMAEQMLLRESKNPQDRTQGLNGFMKLVYSPRQEVNLVNFNFSTGLAYEGLIPGRNRDVFGLAASYSRISSGVRNFNRDLQSINPGTIIPDGEGVIEMIYAAEIAPWWVVVGSLQHIIHPGGSSAKPNATAIGISSRFSL